MTAHTPGPWTADRGRKVSNFADYQAKVTGYDSIGLVTVAVVHAGNGREGNTAGVCTANAALIAAAPEILEALQAFLVYSEGAGDTSSRCVEVEDKARAAIAKAQGKKAAHV